MHRIVQHPSEAAWLAAREDRIGGSTVPRLLNCSPYGTLWDAWAEKHAPHLVIPRPFTASMARGHALEAAVVRAYCASYGAEVKQYDNATIERDDLPWALYSPDGVASDGRIVEVKTERDAWGWPESGTIDPLADAFRREDWLWQALWGCVLTDTDSADVVVLLLGSHAVIVDAIAPLGLTDAQADAIVAACDVRVYTVQAPAALRAQLTRHIAGLRKAHILDGAEPPNRPSNAPRLDEIGKLDPSTFPDPGEGWALAVTAKAARDAAKVADEDRKRLEAVADAASDALMAAMRTTPGWRGPDGESVRWTKNPGGKGSRKHLRFYGFATTTDNAEEAA